MTPEQEFKTDWRQIAQDAWNDPEWKEAAREYHRDRPPTKISEYEFYKWRKESGQ